MADKHPTTKHQHSSFDEALAAAQAELETAFKGDENEHQKYKYVSMDSLALQGRTALSNHGIAFRRTSSEPVYIEGELWIQTTYVASHPGCPPERIVSTTPVVRISRQSLDKAVATALTYSLGYTLRDYLLIDRSELQPDQRNDEAETAEGPHRAPPKAPTREENIRRLEWIKMALPPEEFVKLRDSLKGQKPEHVDRILSRHEAEYQIG